MESTGAAWKASPTGASFSAHASKVVPKRQQTTSQKPECHIVGRHDPSSWASKLRQRASASVAVVVALLAAKTGVGLQAGECSRTGICPNQHDARTTSSSENGGRNGPVGHALRAARFHRTNEVRTGRRSRCLKAARRGRPHWGACDFLQSPKSLPADRPAAPCCEPLAHAAAACALRRLSSFSCLRSCFFTLSSRRACMSTCRDAGPVVRPRHRSKSEAGLGSFRPRTSRAESSLNKSNHT